MRVWMAARLPDVLWAVGLAILFAVVADVISVGSKVRSGFRYIGVQRTKMSDRKIISRIISLEKSRDLVSSDRAFYLASLKQVMIVLSLFSVAGFLYIGNHTTLAFRETQDFISIMDIVTMLIFGQAFVIAFTAVLTLSRSSREKREVSLDKLNKQIEKQMSYLSPDLQRQLAGEPSDIQ